MRGNILSFQAEEAIPAFRFAKVGTAEGKVKLGTAGDETLGVTKDVAAKAGATADVQLDGIAHVECGGSVAFGAKLASDASGKAVTATDGDAYGAIALESGSAGETINIKIVEGSIPEPAAETNEQSPSPDPEQTPST